MNRSLSVTFPKLYILWTFDSLFSFLIFVEVNSPLSLTASRARSVLPHAVSPSHWLLISISPSHRPHLTSSPAPTSPSHCPIHLLTGPQSHSLSPPVVHEVSHRTQFKFYLLTGFISPSHRSPISPALTASCARGFSSDAVRSQSAHG